MYTEDYEISGTLTFSNDKLKKELHQIALNGLKAFVDAYETAYLGSTTLDNDIKISIEDNTRLPYATLGDSVTDAKDFYDLTVAMTDSYEAAKSICELETQQNINTVDLVSGITTSVSKVKKIADDMGDALGFTRPKAGIISSAIGFAGAAIATFDGTTQDEKDALVKSGIDLVGEGLKLALKAIPGVGLLGSVGIDVGVDLAVILATNIYEISQSNKNSEDSQILNDYIAKLNESNLDLKKSLDRERLWIGTPYDDGNKFDGYDTEYKVLALGGNDYIYAYAENMTIYLGNGDDHISNYRTDTRYYKDYGRHGTSLWGAIGNYTTIYGGEGKDTIDNGGIGCVIYAGSDNDSIRNYRENAYIDGENGDDYIKNSELDCIQNGNWSYIRGSHSTIFGGDGNDTIDNSGGGILINGGNDNDSINNHGHTSMILGEDGNDYIYSYESSSTIVPGKGEDLIELEARTYAEYGRLIQYALGDSDDTIYGFLSTDTIQITNGNYFTLKSDDDFIISVGEDSIVLKDALADNDTKINIQDAFGNLITYNDWSVKSGTSGNDSLINAHFNNIRIDSGSGDDYIDNWGGDSVTIEAGAGNDIIDNCGDSVTIEAGTGNDIISLGSNYFHNSQYTKIQYANGDGNDTIYGFNADDTLQISGATYSTVANGNDLIFNIGEGLLYFYDVANKNVTVKIDDNKMRYGTEGDDYTSSISPQQVQSTPIQKFEEGSYDYTGGNKTVSNYTSEDKVKLSIDFTGIDVSGNNFVIKSSSGSLTLENVRDKVIDVAGSDGNTAAYVYMFSGEGFIDGTIADKYEVIVGSENAMNHLKAGNFGSSLIGGGGYTTLTSGASDDFMQGGTSQDIFVYTGGNDVISNYQSGEQVNFAATYTGWTTDGNDLVITAAEGSVRINDAQNKLIEVGDANGNLLAHIYQADGYEGIIDGRGFGAYEVIIGSDNFSNQIFADSTGSSLWGGRGNSNDDLYGNLGIDEYIYSYGNGHDNVFNVGIEDSVNLLNISLEQIVSAEITDKGVNIQFNDGGSLNISGQVENFKVGETIYHANYHNKIWS